jgi:tryptophan synthase alpha chain
VMNRLDAIFDAARGGRAFLIPYICAGDPDAQSTHEMLGAFGEMGIEVVEVGVPFSDPVGDGRSIADAARRALLGGMTLAGTLDICANTPNAPAIVLFSYLSPIARYGFERFAPEAQRSNVSGLIVADLPLEEAARIAPLLRRFGIALTLLIAPSTPLQRAVEIADASDGFVYVVSRVGVTGTAFEPDIVAVEERLRRLRSRTVRRLAVGFGVANPEHVRLLALHADAIVVGSALVDAVAGQVGRAAASAARQFLEPLLNVMPNANRLAAGEKAPTMSGRLH